VSRAMSSTKLIPEFRCGMIAGQPLTIAIDQTMESGWHTYWKNPGDSGEAASISLGHCPPAGRTATLHIPYTAPYAHRATSMNYGYSDRVALLTTLTPPDNIDADEVTLTAEISWLVCADICVPEQTTATTHLARHQETAPHSTRTVTNLRFVRICSA
jgi:DsbC/DsbD-like thiol-disulfide interchange protein